MSAEPRPRPSVLLLEDEPQLTMAMCLNLQSEFDIETAANVEEARLLIASRKFDLLLCDHMMPGKTQGLDFLIEAMSVQPEAKRILITGYMNPELLTRGVPLAKLSGVILKPASVQEVRKTLHEALGKSA